MGCKMTGSIDLGGVHCFLFSLRCLLFELFEKLCQPFTVAHKRFVEINLVASGFKVTFIGLEFLACCYCF